MSAKFVRVVAELQNSEYLVLRVSNISELTEVLGEDLLTAFCCCFVHADRLTSLISFLHTTKAYEDSPIADIRNNQTFLFFTLGVFRELFKSLKMLNIALVKRGIFDRTAWVNGLGRWAAFGDDDDTTYLRNIASFHIDFDTVRIGLRNLGASEQSVIISESDSGKTRHSRNHLGLEALLRGLKLSLEEMRTIVESAGDLLGLHNVLETEFIRAIEASGLEVIKVYNRTPKIKASDDSNGSDNS